MTWKFEKRNKITNEFKVSSFPVKVQYRRYCSTRGSQPSRFKQYQADTKMVVLGYFDRVFIKQFFTPFLKVNYFIQ